MEMRKVLCNELEKMMNVNKDIVIIDADLSKASGTMPLKKLFPDRVFDVGVAEQNMASIAAGLASYGFIPLIFSFTPFATRRICDQIAVSIAYAKQNVKIIGADPGIAAELNGGTHMSVEDIGVIRSIPSMVIFEPVDNVQLVKALPQILEHNGPVYMRMFRKQTADIFNDDYSFNLTSADVLREGSDITLVCSGIMVDEALRAADLLSSKGISAEIINAHTIKPLDIDTISKSAAKTGAVITCENHNIIGGLGSAVAEQLMEICPTPFGRIGIRDQFGEVGKIQDLKTKFNMTTQDICDMAINILSLKKSCQSVVR